MSSPKLFRIRQPFTWNRGSNALLLQSSSYEDHVSERKFLGSCNNLYFCCSLPVKKLLAQQNRHFLKALISLLICRGIQTKGWSPLAYHKLTIARKRDAKGTFSLFDLSVALPTWNLQKVIMSRNWNLQRKQAEHVCTRVSTCCWERWGSQKQSTEYMQAKQNINSGSLFSFCLNNSIKWSDWLD